MTSVRLLVCLAVPLLSAAAVAQKPKRSPTSPALPAPQRDSTNADEDDDERVGQARVQFGVAGGALQYSGGRTEQALGGVLRWIAQPWLSLSVTPTSVRATEPAVTSSTVGITRSGLTDLPMEATVSHGFGGALSASLAASIGATLPVGDTASGLGSGNVGYSVSGGMGFSPAERLWVHLGAGRSLTRFSVQSAFSSGTGWGDVSAGYSVTDRLSLTGGYSSDLGGVDSTLGRSSSIEGGTSIVVRGSTTLNLNASHGVSGVAPRWSIALGFGTAFPYLNHLGAGSAAESLQDTFGGGTHGLPNGGTPGSGGTGTTGKTNRGRGRGP